MRRPIASSRPNYSFKCHYCGGGSAYKNTGHLSKSLERNQGANAKNGTSRSRSIHTTSFRLPPVNQVSQTDQGLTNDDLREELVQLKRQYGVLVKEHNRLKTHLQAAHNDVKKKEYEIENLLQEPITMTKSQEHLKLNSMKRRIIQLERALRHKTTEITQLLSDKNLENAVANKTKLAKIEKQYGQLMRRLEKSIPQSEIEMEKDKLIQQIHKLKHDNDELHQLLSNFMNETDEFLHNDAGGIRDAKMLSRMKEEAAIRQGEVEHYQRALMSLIRNKNSTVDTSTDTLPPLYVKNKRSNETDARQSDFPSKTTVRTETTSLPAINSNNTESSAISTELQKSEKSKKSAKGSAHARRHEKADSTTTSPKLLESSSGSTAVRTNHDNDSNINAIANEYQETTVNSEQEEKLCLLVTALQCQLLRREMIQTRIHSF